MAAEIAAALTLAVGAGLLVQSMRRLAAGWISDSRRRACSSSR